MSDDAAKEEVSNKQNTKAAERSGGTFGYTLGVAFVIVAVSGLARIGWIVGGLLVAYLLGDM